jgi:flagellar hook assembly protein FlgD
LPNGGAGALGVTPRHAVSALQLLPPEPNPARRDVEVQFDLPRAERVDAEVFDVRGQRVRTLAEQTMTPGEHVLTWDERDGSGVSVPAGVFLVRVAAGGESAAREFVVLR